ncbi:uncharacterized protein G2W53_032421 [Senna tora]|uniref:Uncharacterized protein n=1 Tax=Senna tora TaxID=362788 RepID=A0A834W6A8_9FABA|nr:uncharacterized protein G2W53_032421 [Senna tora]
MRVAADVRENFVVRTRYDVVAVIAAYQVKLDSGNREKGGHRPNF